MRCFNFFILDKMIFDVRSHEANTRANHLASAPEADYSKWYIPHPEGKIVAVRFSPASLRSHIADNVGFIDDTFYWLNMTHLVYDGLGYNDDGYADVCTDKLTTLNHPLTYLPWLRKLNEIYPHLQIVWSLPAMPYRYYNSVMDAEIFKNLPDLCAKYNIAAVEVNLQGLALPPDPLAIHQLSHLPEVWFVLPNGYDKEGLVDTALLNKFSNFRYVLNSYGFDMLPLVTSQFDMAVSAFMANYLAYTQKLDAARIMIGIATQGQYRKNQKVKSMPRYEIEKRKGEMILVRDNLCGYSFLKDAEGNSIMYDDNEVITTKLNLLNSLKLNGVVVGDLSQDTYRGSSNSVWTLVAQYSFMQKLGFA